MDPRIEAEKRIFLSRADILEPAELIIWILAFKERLEREKQQEDIDYEWSLIQTSWYLAKNIYDREKIRQFMSSMYDEAIELIKKK